MFKLMLEARTMRNFNSENFLNDLNQQPCAEVCHNAADPNKMWQICTHLSMHPEGLRGLEKRTLPGLLAS